MWHYSKQIGLIRQLDEVQKLKTFMGFRQQVHLVQINEAIRSVKSQKTQKDCVKNMLNCFNVGVQSLVAFVKVKTLQMFDIDMNYNNVESNIVLKGSKTFNIIVDLFKTI